MLRNRALGKSALLWNLYLASFFEGQVTVASGHDSTFLHFFASELSSFLGRNASYCDFIQLFRWLAGVALHGGAGVEKRQCNLRFRNDGMHELSLAVLSHTQL